MSRDTMNAVIAMFNRGASCKAIGRRFGLPPRHIRRVLESFVGRELAKWRWRNVRKLRALGCQLVRGGMAFNTDGFRRFLAGELYAYLPVRLGGRGFK